MVLRKFRLFDIFHGTDAVVPAWTYDRWSKSVKKETRGSTEHPHVLQEELGHKKGNLLSPKEENVYLRDSNVLPPHTLKIIDNKS